MKLGDYVSLRIRMKICINSHQDARQYDAIIPSVVYMLRAIDRFAQRCWTIACWRHYKPIVQQLTDAIMKSIRSASDAVKRRVIVSAALYCANDRF